MPKFTPNLSEIAAGIPILDKGEYEFSIGEVKGTIQNVMTDGVPVATEVVRTSLKIESGESFVGKNIPHSFMPSNEYGAQFTKQFIMAANGFDLKQEAEFNEQFADGDLWSLDSENGVLGDAWKSIQGKKIRANVTQYADKKDPSVIRNNFKWLPF